MPEKLLTLATFATPEEAALAKNRLSEEGIPALLSDSEAVGIAWHLGNAFGGVKLQVAEDDMERGIEALNAAPANESTDDHATAVNWQCSYCQGEVESLHDKCPSCGA